MQEIEHSKKGYMYILDVLIAVTILLVGIAVLFYQYQLPNKTVYFTDQLSEDIVGVLASTKITEYCANPGNPDKTVCSCPNYLNLSQIVCSSLLVDTNANLLSMASEIIETSSTDKKIVQDLIYDIFVKKKVIDEKRFGFAILYTDSSSGIPLELYNTETYIP